MRVLLINPPIVKDRFGRFSKLLQAMPCIGIAYIASILIKEGCNVGVMDYFGENLSYEDLKSRLDSFRPDIVGLTTLTPSAPVVENMCRIIRENNKDTKIILGGIHASLFYEDFLNKGLADIITHGEAEETIVEVLDAIKGHRPLKEIKGIAYREGNTNINTGDREPPVNLDSFPYPAWELFPYTEYGMLPFADIARPTLSISGSRGCPYRCTYCSLDYMGKIYRKRSPESIADEFEYLHRKFNVRQIGFIDPIFPFEEEHTTLFCEELIRRGINKKVVWISETRPDRLNRKLLNLMYRSGARRLLFGIESGSQRVLNSINKRLDLEMTREIIKTAHEENIHIVGLFMIGLPDETEEEIEQTIKFALESDVDFAKFAVTVPFPGSQLYDSLERAGKLKRKDWENFTTFNPDPAKMAIATDTVPAERLLKLQRKATRRFYLRLRMIFRHLFVIRTITPKNLVYGIYALLK
ncbi:MAG: B12-binding domain-containing radical SAM protein [Deltaproteobacteria bacterium]|nr:B12-binding domain-containing radical SAM protein [Deltaproteobacteria bacterium]